jgi:hypothetical protein
VADGPKLYSELIIKLRCRTIKNWGETRHGIAHEVMKNPLCLRFGRRCMRAALR